METARCIHCKKNFILRYKTSFSGDKIPDNFKIVSEIEETPKYICKRCYEKFKRSKVKQSKSKISGGLNAGIADIRAEIEEY